MLYTSIVLAYDGSLDGRRALREGAEIAQQFQAHVHLLAVVRQTASAAIGQSYDPRSLPSNEPEISQTILNEGVEILKGLGLDAQGHDVALVLVAGLLEGTDVSHVTSPLLFEPATIAASMAICRPEAIGDAPARGPEQSGGWRR